jgi:hypothetical protein
LQPVQLVSMSAEPGEIENVAFAEDAVTGPAPQPAKREVTASKSAKPSLGQRWQTGTSAKPS